MAKQILWTKYNRPKKFVEEIDGKLYSEFLEVNNGPVLVDKAFIPLEIQVKNAIKAGEELHMFRLAQYHAMHPDDIPDGYYDPLTIPNYDPTDAQQDLYKIAGRMMSARKEKLERDKNAKESENESDTESDPGTGDPAVDSGDNGEV